MTTTRTRRPPTGSKAALARRAWKLSYAVAALAGRLRAIGDETSASGIEAAAAALSDAATSIERSTQESE